MRLRIRIGAYRMRMRAYEQMLIQGVLSFGVLRFSGPFTGST